MLKSLSSKGMVLDPQYRHMPLRTLGVYAQRIGKVFASATTWARLIRERGWRRHRLRVHPAKPTVGIRASRPNETWHIDVSIVKLLNGTKVYIHAVIDNFSRKIMAWTVAARLDPTTTCQVLAQARGHLDAGAKRPTESNSMIEAWWRSLEHQWLFLSSVDTVEHVRALVAVFLQSHNFQMPHAAFAGQTPDEMHCGTAPNLVAELTGARTKARQLRLATNRAMSCTRCSQTVIPP